MFWEAPFQKNKFGRKLIFLAFKTINFRIDKTLWISQVEMLFVERNKKEAKWRKPFHLSMTMKWLSSVKQFKIEFLLFGFLIDHQKKQTVFKNAFMF